MYSIFCNLSLLMTLNISLVSSLFLSFYAYLGNRICVGGIHEFLSSALSARTKNESSGARPNEKCNTIDCWFALFLTPSIWLHFMTIMNIIWLLLCSICIREKVLRLRKYVLLFLVIKLYHWELLFSFCSIAEKWNVVLLWDYCKKEKKVPIIAVLNPVLGRAINARVEFELKHCISTVLFNTFWMYFFV
jgi:hypothetical protein